MSGIRLKCYGAGEVHATRFRSVMKLTYKPGYVKYAKRKALETTCTTLHKAALLVCRMRVVQGALCGFLKESGGGGGFGP